jgi:UDPglucose--hexose-1-phosphate uridylyltransferase
MDAGASLSHAHTQIITTPIIPPIVKDELLKSRTFYRKNKKCVFCEILSKETKSKRFIWENDNFIVFTPWAAIHPFEFWIFPKKHQPTIRNMTKKDGKKLAYAMRVSFGGLKTLLNDPSYNFGFHMFPEECYHWHIEVYPKLTIWAGFEKNTGIFINAVPPEEGAKNLRKVFKKEEKNLGRSNCTY